MTGRVWCAPECGCARVAPAARAAAARARFLRCMLAFMRVNKSINDFWKFEEIPSLQC